MIVHNCTQGTSEWLQLRAGIPTASAFDMILTKSGKPSQSAERYFYTLLAERLMGHPIAEHISFWMQRGSEMEREALRYYEFQRDEETTEVGFITNDAGTIGASPDRLVGEDGLLEIKCPRDYVHVGYMLQSGKAYDEYKVQCQSQLWVTGRKWTDVLSYHPELPMALVRIERDDDFIELIEAAVTTFSLELERRWEELQARGWGRPAQRKPEKSASDAMREALLEVKGR